MKSIQCQVGWIGAFCAAVGIWMGSGAVWAAVRPGVAGVVDDTRGKPIIGATVYVYTAHPRFGTGVSCPSCYTDCGKTATTDAGGRFRIASLDPNLIFRLLVVRDGYASGFVDEVDPAKATRVRAALSPRKLDTRSMLVLHGRVVDGGGAAVVGAAVSPQGVDFAEPVKMFGGETTGMFGDVPGMDELAITDRHGEFRLKVPAKTGAVYARVEARGLAPLAATGLKPGPTAANLVRMHVGATVEGTVLCPGGVAAADATVEVVPVDLNAGTFTGWHDIATDASGNFSLPNLPPNTECNFMVLMGSPALAGRDLAAPIRRFTTGANGAVTNLGGVTLAASERITGRVVLADGRALPAGTRILLNRDGTWDGQQAVLGADGAFEFGNVPLGDRIGLFTTVAGYALDPASDDYDSRTRSILLTLTSASAAARVTVRLASDGDHGSAGSH